MAYCTHCGKPLLGNPNYCTHCGGQNPLAQDNRIASASEAKRAKPSIPPKNVTITQIIIISACMFVGVWFLNCLASGYNRVSKAVDDFPTWPPKSTQNPATPTPITTYRSTPEPTPTPTPDLDRAYAIAKTKLDAALKDYEARSRWTSIGQWRGDGDLNTQTFMINSDEWAIVWQCGTNRFGTEGAFYGYIMNPDTNIMEDSFGSSMQGTSYFYKSGRYYIKIISSAPWAITVSQRGSKTR